jgi:hypothetical protein
MNFIPPKIIINPLTRAENTKITLIKGIRGYTGMSLKEAKEASEEKTERMVLRRRPDRNVDMERQGIEGIKASGATILSGGMQTIVDHLEAAVRSALDEGYYDTAAEILDILRRQA